MLHYPRTHIVMDSDDGAKYIREVTHGSLSRFYILTWRQDGEWFSQSYASVAGAMLAYFAV